MQPFLTDGYLFCKPSLYLSVASLLRYTYYLDPFLSFLALEKKGSSENRKYRENSINHGCTLNSTEITDFWALVSKSCTNVTVYFREFWHPPTNENNNNKKKGKHGLKEVSKPEVRVKQALPIVCTAFADPRT